MKHTSKTLVMLLCSSIVSSSLAQENEDVAANFVRFSPMMNIFGIGSKKRNIGELNLMLPVFQRQQDLTLIDIKAKTDNKKSYEINLGLAHRHNFNDRFILGVYNYYDYRKSSNNLYVSQWTGGLEIFTKYIDFRANAYIPHNRRKTVKPDSTYILREGTKIYGIKKAPLTEYALRGHDLELGLPIFSFSDKLDAKIGTKFYVTKYQFAKKSVTKNSGIRLRIEQPIFKEFFNDKQDSELSLVIGTNKMNHNKRDNFVGINFKMSFGSNSSNFKRTGLNRRMMDNIIRDVDIVTSTPTKEDEIVEVIYNGNKIDRIISYRSDVGDDHEGDGTKENPYSKKQLSELIENKELVLTNADLVVKQTIDENGNVKDLDVNSLTVASDGEAAQVVKINDVKVLSGEEKTEKVLVKAEIIKIAEEAEVARVAAPVPALAPAPVPGGPAGAPPAGGGAGAGIPAVPAVAPVGAAAAEAERVRLAGEAAVKKAAAAREAARVEAERVAKEEAAAKAEAERLERERQEREDAAAELPPALPLAPPPPPPSLEGLKGFTETKKEKAVEEDADVDAPKSAKKEEIPTERASLLNQIKGDEAAKGLKSKEQREQEEIAKVKEAEEAAAIDPTNAEAKAKANELNLKFKEKQAKAEEDRVAREKNLLKRAKQEQEVKFNKEKAEKLVAFKKANDKKYKENLKALEKLNNDIKLHPSVGFNRKRAAIRNNINLTTIAINEYESNLQKIQNAPFIFKNPANAGDPMAKLGKNVKEVSTTTATPSAAMKLLIEGAPAKSYEDLNVSAVDEDEWGRSSILGTSSVVDFAQPIAADKSSQDLALNSSKKAEDVKTKPKLTEENEEMDAYKIAYELGCAEKTVSETKEEAPTGSTSSEPDPEIVALNAKLLAEGLGNRRGALGLDNNSSLVDSWDDSVVGSVVENEVESEVEKPKTGKATEDKDKPGLNKSRLEEFAGSVKNTLSGIFGFGKK